MNGDKSTVTLLILHIKLKKLHTSKPKESSTSEREEIRHTISLIGAHFSLSSYYLQCVYEENYYSDGVSLKILMTGGGGAGLYYVAAMLLLPWPLSVATEEGRGMRQEEFWSRCRCGEVVDQGEQHDKVEWASKIWISFLRINPKYGQHFFLKGRGRFGRGEQQEERGSRL